MFLVINIILVARISYMIYKMLNDNNFNCYDPSPEELESITNNK